MAVPSPAVAAIPVAAADAAVLVSVAQAADIATWQLLLKASRDRYEHLVDEIDPQWVLPWLPAALCDPAARTPSDRDRLSAALLARFGLSWPALSCWKPPLHRIGLLPRADALRVLSALALFCNPSLLTRSVDANRWRQVRELLGEAACEALIARSLPLVRPRPTSAGHLTATMLARDGLETLVAGMTPGHDDLVNVMRFYLPVPGELQLHIPISARCVSAVMMCTAFYAHLDEFIPDLLWLFGSNSAE